MEVNQPDRGIFKGIGSLDKHLDTSKKNFPLIRNKHQYQYTHNHGNMYQSSFNYFHKTKFLAHSETNRNYQEKANKISNASQIVFGSDKNDFKSLTKVDFTKYDNFKTSKPIFHK